MFFTFLRFQSMLCKWADSQPSIVAVILMVGREGVRGKNSIVWHNHGTRLSKFHCEQFESWKRWGEGQEQKNMTQPGCQLFIPNNFESYLHVDDLEGMDLLRFPPAEPSVDHPDDDNGLSWLQKSSSIILLMTKTTVTNTSAKSLDPYSLTFCSGASQQYRCTSLLLTSRAALY